MRLESTGKEGTYKVWMSDDELQQLRRATTNYRDDLLIQLGGYVGLRAFEIPQIKPKHIKRTDDGDHYHLRVPRGKDTQNGTGKPRDAYLPREVESDMHRFQTGEELGRNDPYIPLSTRGVRAVVERTAERAAQETGDDDFQHVSSHDLRRRYAQRLLVDKSMNPRVVMAVGGWSSFQAIEPYLNAPTADVVNAAFEKAELA
jgi:integrase